MERLTEKRNGENAIPLKADHAWALTHGQDGYQYLSGEAADRLAAYEATGLTPKEAADAYHQGRVRALDEIAGGVYDGLIKNSNILLLSCKPNDTVYWISKHQKLVRSLLIIGVEINTKGVCEYSCTGGDYTPVRFYPRDIGKTVFLTHAEAEVALAEVKK